MHKLIGYPFNFLESLIKPVLVYHNLNMILGDLMIWPRLVWPLLVTRNPLHVSAVYTGG